ncbi:AcvB/VirJ family lysyl-phosphatidylglycerol hydrolase, partial [Xanthomonas sp. SHU 308]
LAARVAAHLHARGRGGALDDLPLTELPSATPGAPLAIVLSGDGGWRDIDKGMAEALQRRGIAVVGWDSLRYFWRAKPPARASADLSRVIAYYQQRWRPQKILLVGYSFGATTLPFMVNRLPPAQRQQVGLVALLGLEHKADFQIRVRGWLNLGDDDDALPVQPELARIPAAQLLCVYGDKEKDTLCPQLRARGAEVVVLHGGHHFDQHPAGLATIVDDRWQQLSADARLP